MSISHSKHTDYNETGKSAVEVYLNSFPLLRKVDQTLKVNIKNPKANNLQ